MYARGGFLQTTYRSFPHWKLGLESKYAVVGGQAQLRNHAEPFTEDEADLVRGAMALSTIKVSDVMVPIDKASSRHQRQERVLINPK